VQLGEARRFIQRKGWTLSDAHIFIEDAVSRAEFKKRPVLLRLIRAAEAREFDFVVTRDETRIGGDMIRTGLVISNLLDVGVKLWFYYEDREVVLDNATDKFLMAAKNFASELEREKIAQRTFEHLMTKARKGLNAGGRCYGYDNQRGLDGVEYVINDMQGEVIREIFTRYANGDGLRTIVKALNSRSVPSPRAGKKGTGSWSLSVVRSMLRNERYLGVVIYGQRQKTYKGGTKVRVARPKCDWVRVEVPKLRIVSDELWAAAHAQMRTVERLDGKGRVSGRKPKYMLSQLARCSTCGGPIKVTNSKSNQNIIKVYTCAYNKERGVEVCPTTLRRPVDVVNGSLIEWLRLNVLSEELVVLALREARRRLEERHEATTTDLPNLEREGRGLRTEIDRLVAAVATSDDKPEPLVKAIGERQDRLNDIEARLRAVQAAPKAIDLELRRMEAEAKKRIDHLEEVFERNPDEAREALSELFPSKLTFTQIVTANGPRFQIEGEAVIGRLLAVEGFPNVASPTGFEALGNLGFPKSTGSSAPCPEFLVSFQMKCVA
jgi:DNA invertase Pin-like site-specific DNA recombinase